MRLTNLIKPVLAILLLISMMSSCKKDEATGDVKVIFKNHSTDIQVTISPIVYPLQSITPNLKPDFNGTLIYELNPGNYILIPSSVTGFNSVGFQIREGETTTIKYDVNNIGQIQ